MPAPRPVRVVVADDHPIVVKGLVDGLAAYPELTVVGVAANGRELLAVAAQTSPDVVVADQRMPEMRGTEAARVLLAAQPGLAVVILTMRDDGESVFAAVRAGVRGYVLKDAEPDEIARAILAVADGYLVLHKGVTSYVVGRMSAATTDGPAYPFPDLSERERQVLELMTRGARNHVIAADLHLSEKTVRNHVSAILFKLRVPNRVEAVVRARDAGLGAGS